MTHLKYVQGHLDSNLAKKRCNPEHYQYLLNIKVMMIKREEVCSSWISNIFY